MAVPTPDARRITSLRPRALAVAAVLAALFAILAVLTTLLAVVAWDARIDLAVNTDVGTDSALHAVALAVSVAGSPVAVDALTVIAVIVVWVRGTRVRRVRAVVYLVAARLVELGVETGVKYLMNHRRQDPRSQVRCVARIPRRPPLLIARPHQIRDRLLRATPRLVHIEQFTRRNRKKSGHRPKPGRRPVIDEITGRPRRAGAPATTRPRELPILGTRRH